jgi:FkbM family methyltransferase
LGRYVDVAGRLLNNDSANIRLNGEAWLLAQLGGRVSTVFDVGANRGAWTQEALRMLPYATLHSFEPIPETYVELFRRLGSSDRVRLNQMALSDQPSGSLQMWTDGRDGQMASATAPPPEGGGRPLVVPCTTGDEYVSARAIDHIDLLKIDVEGHEMEVLRGFRRCFEREAVDVVQFEFTLWAALARRWLADYYDVLSQWGFRIGKLWPRSVRWSDYRPEDEQFLRCNFVAVRPGSPAARILGAS